MGRTSHNIPINDEDWDCLGIYAINKKTDRTKLIGKFIYNFLRDHKVEIKGFIEEQKKIIESRKDNP